MAFTIEQLNPVFAKMKNVEALGANLSLAIDYLTGKLPQLPAFDDNHINYKFAQLSELLLQPDITPENEALLLSLFNAPQIRIEYYIARQLFLPLQENKDQAAFDKALSIIDRVSFTRDQLFFDLMQTAHLSEEDIRTGSSPLLNFMHAYVAQMPEAIINDASRFTFHFRDRFDWRFFYFLHRSRTSKAFEYAMRFKRNDGHDKTYDLLVMNSVLNVAFDTYGPEYKEIAEAMLSNGNKIMAGYHLYLVYNEYLTEENSLELARWSEAYLEYHVSKQDSYENNFSSRKYKVSEESYFYMPLHGWALYFILKNNEAKAKEFLPELAAPNLVFTADVLKMLIHETGAAAIPWLLSAVFQKDTKHRENDRLKYIFEKLTTFKGQFDLDVLWQLEKYTGKEAKDNAVNYLVQHDTAVTEKATKAIGDKKKDVRLMAAQILLALDTPETKDTLRKALDTETDDTTRDLIWQTCGRDLAAETTEATLIDMVESAKKRGKLKKPVFTWLDEASLPALYLLSGRPLNADEVRLILYRMSRAKGMRTDPEIKPVLQLIDRERSAGFAKALYKSFEEKEYDSKYKFLLLMAAIFGNDDMVNKFCSATNKFIEDGRKVMSEYGIEALALQGSNKALRWIEWYSRKYRTKKTYVSETAFKALTAAAEELEITTHELGDRIVPDFGFEGLFKHFTINGDEYRAFIDSNFKLAFFNDSNKKIKSLPAAAGNELKEEFKSIAKEVRDVVKAQSSRLEHYLVVQRKWTVEEWQQFFLNNPIMFIYAIKLLWGVYDAAGKLLNCFVCQEDTTLVDAAGNEMEMPEGNFIGIVHPISLSSSDLQTWKQQFFDLSIDPVFPQLERPVFSIAEEDKSKTVVETFAGVITDSGSIKNTLDRYGWRRGDSSDGGRIYAFLYTDYANNIQAIFQVDGVNAFGFEDEATLGKLYFVDMVKRNANKFYDETHAKKDWLVSLDQLSPVFYCEVVSAIKAIKVRDIQ